MILLYIFVGKCVALWCLIRRKPLKNSEAWWVRYIKVKQRGKGKSRLYFFVEIATLARAEIL